MTNEEKLSRDAVDEIIQDFLERGLVEEGRQMLKKRDEQASAKKHLLTLN